MAYLRPHSTFVAEQEVDLVSLQAMVSPHALVYHSILWS